MVNSIKGSLASALRNRKVNTAYLEELKERKLTFNNLESIQQLIDEAGDEDSEFREDFSDFRSAEEVIDILQQLYELI